MSGLFSRVLVALVGLPVVLGIVWLGGWWLFGLVAAIARGGRARVRADGASAAAARTGCLRRVDPRARRRRERRRRVDARRLPHRVRRRIRAQRRRRDPRAVDCGDRRDRALRGVDRSRPRSPGAVAEDARRAAPARIHRDAHRVRRGHVRVFRRPPDRPPQARADAVARARRGRASSSARSSASSSRSSPSTPTGTTTSRSGRRSLLGFVVVIAAAAGDLFESMLKRDMRVKDTGRVLGGHGGVLDRIDALLFASAAAFYLVLGFNYV